MKLISNVRVGKPKVKPTVSAHTWGVRQGNKPRSLERSPGMKLVGSSMAAATTRRSTGIGHRQRKVVDPRMPFLTPP